ncbi:plasmid replication protein [Campylobacter sp. MIT 19-121]|nr:plasmid replication protein [Campylobacter sp. MIT 19-121]NDJ28037.1 plasmid replication protein [Campylobacter sp. MIT 19-121]
MALESKATFYEKVVDKITGEVNFIEVAGMTYKYMGERDFNFMKMFYENFINVLESYFQGSNFKVSVLKFLLLNADKQNCVFATSQEIANVLKTTQQAVAKEMKILQDCNFIKKVRNGVYQINADILFKGSAKKRQEVKEKFTTPFVKH